MILTKRAFNRFMLMRVTSLLRDWWRNVSAAVRWIIIQVKGPVRQLSASPSANRANPVTCCKSCWIKWIDFWNIIWIGPWLHTEHRRMLRSCLLHICPESRLKVWQPVHWMRQRSDKGMYWGQACGRCLFWLPPPTLTQILNPMPPSRISPNHQKNRTRQRRINRLHEVCFISVHAV